MLHLLHPWFPKFNLNLNNIITYTILGIGIYFLVRSNVNLRNELQVSNGNYKSLSALVGNIKSDQARQQQFTADQFKYYYHHIDSIANKIKIPTKSISDVIVSNYHYKDTTIVKADTTHIGQNIQFKAILACYEVKGTIRPDITVLLNSVALNDKLTTFLYKAPKMTKFSFVKQTSYDKHFLGFNWMNHFTAKTYSECKHDTINVEENIHIIK